MNDQKINSQERQAWARRLGWTTHQVRQMAKQIGNGKFRELAAANELPQPGERQKRRDRGEPQIVTDFETWRDQRNNE